MDDISGMRGFVKVVEAGSFTRAAELLRMPRSSLTKSVQELEARLRVTLLHRTTRRVTVTAEGAAYYERLVRLLDAFDDLHGSLSAAQGRPAGRLRVESGAPLVDRILLPALPDFLDRYPDIRIEFSISDRQADLIGEDADCALRAGTLSDPSLIARFLGDMANVTVASPAYLERMGVPASPAELEETHLAVSYMNATTGRLFPFDFAQGEERHVVRCRNRVAVSEGRSYVAAALAGLGVIQAPLVILRDELASGTLRPILTDWAPKPRPLNLVYPPNRHVSARLRAFIDWALPLFARA